MDASDRSRSPLPSPASPRGLGRRDFLRGSAAGLGLSVLQPARALAGPEAPEVRRRVTLGATGLQIPDIGFGSSRLAGDEALVRHALERGITYFDTAEMYTDTRAEQTLGRALAGRRDDILITSKFKAEAHHDRADIMAALERSLRRLKTDHVDTYLNHAVNDFARLENPEWFEFAERAKQQGKIRFAGFSGHGGRLAELVDRAADKGLADVLLVAHNFGQDPAFYERFTRRLDFVATQQELPAALAKARAKGIGVVAMKTLRGARLNDLRAYEGDGATFAQAAFRWVLSSGHVDALVVTMKSPEMVDEYLGASGWRGSHEADLGLLRRYEARNGASQCRYGCSACADACPHEVAISEVLRTRMYDRDYGDRALGREDYAKLGAGAAACVSCSHQSCTGACPFGLSIPELTADAHRRLG